MNTNPIHGGSYTRAADGTLKRTAFTGDRECACRPDESASDEVAIGAVPENLHSEFFDEDTSSTDDEYQE